MVCHAVARRRRRKVRVSDFDLCAFDSQRVVRGCSVIDTEQPRPTHWSPYRLGTMELCQLALVARRKTPGSAGRIGRVEATKQSPRSVFIPVREYLASAAALEAYSVMPNRRHGRLADI